MGLLDRVAGDEEGAVDGAFSADDRPTRSAKGSARVHS